MDERDRSLILEFKNRLPDEVLAHISKVIAFGSRVRGEASEDSDLDLVILVDCKTPELENQIDDIAYQVMWDHDFKLILSIKVLAESHYLEALKEGFSFYKAVEREGVLL